MTPASFTNHIYIMDLQDKITDILLALPQGVAIGGERYHFYAPTLGISMMAARYLHALDLDEHAMKMDLNAYILELVCNRRADLCRLVALFTLSGKEEAWDVSVIERRAAQIAAHADDSELAMMLTMVLQQTDLDEIYSGCGIKSDRMRQSRIAAFKRSKGSAPEQFGGHTVFGSLLDRAAERYGWTKDYIVWGIDLASLQIMMADSVSAVFLSDDERKHLGTPAPDDEVVDANSPEARKRLRNHKWN